MCQMRGDFLRIPYLAQFSSPNTWCNRIYLNTRFHCGPYFLKSKLNTLPRCFGPGPIVYVVQKLVQMLISASDKPFKLLKVLQASRRSLSNASNTSTTSASHLATLKSKCMQRLRFKAKEKGKYNYRELEICTRQAHLDEYLSDLCIKLKCCSKMISLNEPGEEQKGNSRLNIYF